MLHRSRLLTYNKLSIINSFTFRTSTGYRLSHVSHFTPSSSSSSSFFFSSSTYVNSSPNLPTGLAGGIHSLSVIRSSYQYRSPCIPVMLRRFFGLSSSKSSASDKSLSNTTKRMEDEDEKNNTNTEGSSKKPNKDILLTRIIPTTDNTAASNGSSVPHIHGYEPIGYLHQLPSLAHYISSTGDDICIAVLPPSSSNQPSSSTVLSSTTVTPTNGYYPRIHAVGNICPHKQASMHLGDIEDLGTKFDGDSSIICPRHRKKYPKGLHFDLCNGKSFLYEPPLAKYDANWCLPVYSIILLHENEATSENIAQSLVYVSSEPQNIQDKETVHLMKKLKQENQTVKSTVSTGYSNNDNSNGGKIGTVSGVALLASVSESNNKDNEDDGREPNSSKESPSSSTSILIGSSSSSSSSSSIATTSIVPHSSDAVWIPFTIMSVKSESPDTNIYSLEYTENIELSVRSSTKFSFIRDQLQRSKVTCNSSSWHVSMCLQPSSLSREYTPISSFKDFVDGTVDLTKNNSIVHKIELLIKIYPNGKLTKQLIPYGKDHILYVSLPETTIALPQMLPMEILRLQPELQSISVMVPTSLASFGPSFLFICGGTGITPILQLLQFCIEQERMLHDSTKNNGIVSHIYVIISNHTVKDILCRSTVASFLTTVFTSLRIHVLYTCTKIDNNSLFTPLSIDETMINKQNSNHIQFTTGRINKEMMVTLLEPLLVPSSSLSSPAILHRVVVSGPRGMYETVRDILLSITTAQNTPIILHDYAIVELEA